MCDPSGFPTAVNRRPLMGSGQIYRVLYRVPHLAVSGSENAMGYVVERNGRLYAVVYAGVDPITGKDRRTWRAAGTIRSEAEAMVERLVEDNRMLRTVETSARGLTVGAYLQNSWLPAKKLEVRPTTLARYEWMINHYVIPHLGTILLRHLLADAAARRARDRRQ